jgi:hypothetical protein
VKVAGWLEFVKDNHMENKSDDGEFPISFSPEGTGIIPKCPAADFDENLTLQLIWVGTRGGQRAIGAIAICCSAV